MSRCFVGIDGCSGYALGRDALKKVFESYDGREPETLLWEKVKVSRLDVENGRAIK